MDLLDSFEWYYKNRLGLKHIHIDLACLASCYFQPFFQAELTYGSTTFWTSVHHNIKRHKIELDKNHSIGSFRFVSFHFILYKWSVSARVHAYLEYSTHILVVVGSANIHTHSLHSRISVCVVFKNEHYDFTSIHNIWMWQSAQNMTRERKRSSSSSRINNRAENVQIVRYLWHTIKLWFRNSI